MILHDFESCLIEKYKFHVKRIILLCLSKQFYRLSVRRSSQVR